MSQINHHRTATQKRTLRVRMKVRGTTTRPRLTVHRSNKSMFMQVVDDQTGKTLAATSTVTIEKGTKTEKTTAAATKLAQELKKQKISKIVFDRGGYRYHGRVKAVAEAMREQGLEV
jgi:large subunit ribosomal protein L18